LFLLNKSDVPGRAMLPSVVVHFVAGIARPDIRVSGPASFGVGSRLPRECG